MSSIYLENCFKKSKFSLKSRYDVAKKLGEVSLMFEIDPSFSKSSMLNISKKIDRVIQSYKKENKNYE